jgi:hypothetical protein
MTTENLAAPGAAAEITAPAAPELEIPQVEGADAPATEPAETEAEKEAKAVKQLQRRIDKRTRDLYAERAEKEQLRRELDALKNTGKQSPEDAPDIEALTERRARELVEQQTLQGKVRATLEKGRALADFDQAVNTAIEDLGLLDSKGRPTPHLAAVLDADAPHELIHYLGTNPDVADSLQGLSPTQFAYRLARIEAQMQAGKAPKQSTAPKPLTPVQPASKPTAKADSEMSDAEWYRQRRKR